MDNLIFQERKSKVEEMQNNILISNAETTVQKPHRTVKTLFNGNNPKNRKNLKKLCFVEKDIEKNDLKKTLPRMPSIQSLITNSKKEEFLSLEKPNYFQSHKTIPLVNFSSSSTLLTLNNNNNSNLYQNQNQNIVNNTLNNGNNNNFDYNYLNSNESLPLMTNKKESKMSKKTKSFNGLQKEKDLNQLYQEFLENVSKIYLCI